LCTATDRPIDRQETIERWRSDAQAAGCEIELVSNGAVSAQLDVLRIDTCRLSSRQGFVGGLIRAAHSISNAAALLGMHRRTLQRLLGRRVRRRRGRMS